jgi:MerR family transcriptional regulator, copper efflux regulator
MKSSRRRPWTIGELAERFDLPTHVLRHWEDMGLLAPERDSAGRRQYVEADLYRVAVILSSKAAGMSLEQVRNLVDGSAEGRHTILTDHLIEIDARAAELERSRLLTLHALECRAHDISTCPNFRAQVADLVGGTTQGFPRGKRIDRADHALGRLDRPAIMPG